MTALLTSLTVSELLELISQREVSAEEITAECRQNIKKYNPLLNAIITENTSQVPPKSKRGALSGIPYVLKDCFSTKDLLTTCASKVLNGYCPPYNATIVDHLNQADGVLLGKANMDAWGHGGSTENTDYGPAKNPWNTDHVAGGSSGGVAVAVAAGMAIFGIGEDTGGSIRNPAGWCNLTGLKVTYGRVSRYGSIAYASSFDTVGPMGKSAEDCALVLKSIAGVDPKDATTSPETVPDYPTEIKKNLDKLVIGVPKEFFPVGLDKEIKACLDQAVADLTSLGVDFVEVSLPSLEHAVSTYYLLAPSETSSNLARYDGVRFGTGRDNFSDETKRRIMVGTYALSTGYYDAYYLKAQKIRTIIIRDYQKIFSRCDAIISPISPTVAPKIGELINDPVKSWLADVFTVITNTAGIPSIALPGGFSSVGLPIGFQIQGPMFSESLLLRIGYHYQQITDWHKRRPELKD